MKIKDLAEYNPEADLGLIDKDGVFKPLEIYGYGGGEDDNKFDCDHVTLQVEGDEDVRTENV